MEQPILSLIETSRNTTEGAYHLPEKSDWADRMHNGNEVTVLCDQPDGMDLTICQTGKRDRRARISRHFLQRKTETEKKGQMVR